MIFLSPSRLIHMASDQRTLPDIAQPFFWTTPLWALGILLLFLIPMIARIRLAEYLTHGATLWIRLGVPLLHYCISSTCS